MRHEHAWFYSCVCFSHRLWKIHSGVDKDFASFWFSQGFWSFFFLCCQNKERATVDKTAIISAFLFRSACLCRQICFSQDLYISNIHIILSHVNHKFSLKYSLFLISFHWNTCSSAFASPWKQGQHEFIMYVCLTLPDAPPALCSNNSQTHHSHRMHKQHCCDLFSLDPRLLLY